MAKRFSALPVAAQVALLAALPVMMALAVYRYAVQPMSVRCEGLEAQAKSLHQQNLRYKAFEQQRGQYLRRIAELRVELEAARAAVPDDPATDGLIDMVSDTAMQSAVHVRSLVAQ
ncbi:MAG TPA: hypothetical protein VKU44_08130, partial [Terriglobia bacterium]|nr:hypothetical protein [Terriglobia bacterium]